MDPAFPMLVFNLVAAVLVLLSGIQVHPNMITKWKREALTGLKDSFAKGSPRSRDDREAEIKTLPPQPATILLISSR
jgi:hypothetical protein